MQSIRNMPNLVNSGDCCGCSACASTCPRTAISMQADDEGFLHPVIDEGECIECRQCETVCPGLNPAYNNDAVGLTYVVQHKDEAVRYQSTSGGAFTAIAEEIIRRNGVVFGAIMTKEMRVVHDSVETIEELGKFRNSKYVQSEIGDCLIRVRDLLNAGRWVCFSGTPCQINGLIKFLKKDYHKLITVDVVCKSVPSPLVFNKYVEFKKEKEGPISDIVFRDKKRGFLYCTMAHYLSHEDRMSAKDCYRRGSESDEWLRLFLSGMISRRSCINCGYQTLKRVSDITLGDIWETGVRGLDDNKGTTLLSVWTHKGLEIIGSITNEARVVEYPMVRRQERINTNHLDPDRNKVFHDLNHLSAEEFFRKYSPRTIKVRMKEFGRFFVWKLHLHNFIRRIKHFVIHM